jgi:hypothetical protein
MTRRALLLTLILVVVTVSVWGVALRLLEAQDARPHTYTAVVTLTPLARADSDHLQLRLVQIFTYIDPHIDGTHIDPYTTATVTSTTSRGRSPKQAITLHIATADPRTSTVVATEFRNSILNYLAYIRYPGAGSDQIVTANVAVTVQ